MSLYFYSRSKSQIAALAGVKCLVFPPVERREDGNLIDIEGYIRRKLNSSDPDVFSNLLDEMASHEGEVIPNLSEELDHFNNLVKSKISGVFHLRNIFIRNVFSRENRKLYSQSLRSRRVHRQVLIYFGDYIDFHHASYSMVEAAYKLKSKMDLTQNPISMLYADDLEDVIHETRIALKNDNIGKRIDSRYIDLKNKINGSRRSFRTTVWKEVVPLFLLRGVWTFGITMLIEYGQLIPSYVMGRFRSISEQARTGNLPSIICGNLFIDPVSFHFGNMSHKGTEKRFTQEGKILNDLLWYLLSRSALAAKWLKNAKRPTEIIDELYLLRTFFSKWRYDKLEPIFSIAFDLDKDIVLSVEKELKSTGFSFNTEKLEQLCIDLYSNGWKERILNLPDCSKLGMYLNCAYHHI